MCFYRFHREIKIHRNIIKMPIFEMKNTVNLSLLSHITIIIHIFVVH
jgi:hypothetical protein